MFNDSKSGSDTDCLAVHVQEFVIVYFHTLTTSDNRPELALLRDLYSIVDHRCVCVCLYVSVFMSVVALLLLFLLLLPNN